MGRLRNQLGLGMRGMQRACCWILRKIQKTLEQREHDAKPILGTSTAIDMRQEKREGEQVYLAHPRT